MTDPVRPGEPALDYDAAAEYIAGFYPKGTPVDWDDALYRVESAFGIDLPDQMLDPVILKIKKAVREVRRQEGS